MAIYIENRKRKLENIQKDYPEAIILDVSSKSETKSLQKLSPFYPHKNIPIPFTENIKAVSVEGIWQGLKVFEKEDVSFPTFENDTMKNIKRSVRKYGKPLGHRKGAYGKEILNYFDARMLIYIPTYKWMLENIESVNKIVNKIKEQSQKQDIVLLDYNTNTEFRDISKPLSHAGLIKLYIEDNYPREGQTYEPMIIDKTKKKKRKAKTKEKIVKATIPSLFDIVD